MAPPRSSTWSMVAHPLRAAIRRRARQGTSTNFIKVLAAHSSRISTTDSKGAWHNNVFVGRSARTIRCEAVCWLAQAGIGRYPSVCSRRRPQSSLDAKAPDQA